MLRKPASGLSRALCGWQGRTKEQNRSYGRTGPFSLAMEIDLGGLQPQLSVHRRIRRPKCRFILTSLSQRAQRCHHRVPETFRGPLIPFPEGSTKPLPLAQSHERGPEPARWEPLPVQPLHPKLPWNSGGRPARLHTEEVRIRDFTGPPSRCRFSQGKKRRQLPGTCFRESSDPVCGGGPCCPPHEDTCSRDRKSMS